MRSSCTSKLIISLVVLWCATIAVHASPDEGLQRIGKVDVLPTDPSDPGLDTLETVPPPAIGDPLGPGETGPELGPLTPEEDKKNQALSCIAGCRGSFECANTCITTTYGNGPAPAALGGNPTNPDSAPPSGGQLTPAGGVNTNKPPTTTGSNDNPKPQGSTAASHVMHTATVGMLALVISVIHSLA
ncbi:hypothetical protein BGW42_007873 [Actinomortierella wolfii]|nr:hypothetical protein BGW42_007873 [Actinomortierella wolfii]